MTCYKLINVSRNNCCPLQYKFIVHADFKTASFLRRNLPKYIFDKDDTVVIKTVVYADNLILSDCNAATSDDLKFSYLYNVSSDCSDDLVFKLGISSTNSNFCSLLKQLLPTFITSTDGSLTIKVFQYYNKSLIQNTVRSELSPVNNCGCGGCGSRCRCGGCGGCGCGCGGCGGCGCGWLWGGLALLALCFC